MRALLGLLASTRVAFAQPDPYPKPLPADPVVEPPPQPEPLVMKPDEAALLQRGEIGDDKLVYGIVGNALVGFGLGQALQGRWLNDGGWRFTLGMGGSMVLFFAAAGVEGQNAGIELVAAAGLLTFYVWGIVDAATGPQRHNNRVREIKWRYGIPLAMPYVKTHDGASTAGLVVRF